MNLLNLIRDRYSVRDYADRLVEPEKLNYILECARLAPSAVNRQPWRFVVVRSEAKRAALATCYAREWFAAAPLYVVVCADTNRSWKRAADGHEFADVDAAIAAEHLCLAAAEQGLGCCWVCNFDPVKCREVLELGQGEYPVAIFPIGYAAADQAPVKQRRPAGEVVTEI